MEIRRNHETGFGAWLPVGRRRIAWRVDGDLGETAVSRSGGGHGGEGGVSAVGGRG